MTENALIRKADMVFDDICGKNGRNFRLTLQLKTTYGGVNVSFNPMRLPQLLEHLGLERFSELEGTYIQIPKTNFGETVKSIKSIMAKRDEEWFKTENDIYFGSEFFKGYGDECCKLLNDLYDENQLLHKINEDTIDFMYDNFDLNIIFTDRELNDICNEMGWELSEKGIKINQLEKENEQLKKRNEFLKKRCDEYWEEAGLNNDYFE